MKRLIKNSLIALTLGVCLFTSINIAKADTSGRFSIDSYADVATSKASKYGKDTPAIAYSNYSGTGSFFTRVIKVGFFGGETIKATSSVLQVTSTSMSNTISFPNIGSGNYKFQAQWKSGGIAMDYNAYSYNMG